MVKLHLLQAHEEMFGVNLVSSTLYPKPVARQLAEDRKAQSEAAECPRCSQQAVFWGPTASREA